MRNRNTTMTDTANIITTGTGKEGLWPGSTFYPAQTIAPDALIFSQTSVGGTISGDGPVARIPYIKDGLDAAIVAEGTRITETDPDLSEMYVHTHKIAILTPISNEAADYTQTTSLIQAGMVKAITDKADRLLLQGDEAGIKGLP